nr:putative reverse transcriptase domain-containing protein [Tanacetum cinerariifolium]
MFLEESDEVEKYVGGLPDMIHESVKASMPKTMHKAIEFITELMDQKILTLAERQAKKRESLMTLQGTIKTNNSHSKGTIWDGLILQGLRKKTIQRIQTSGNRAGNGNVVARAYVVGTVGINLNSNVVMGMFLLDNRYALILFDTGADRSFMSTAFSSLINIIPTTLDHDYDVELANERGNRAGNGNVIARTYVVGTAGINLNSNVAWGNRAGNGNVVARAYAVGNAGIDLNFNVVMGTFLLNNRYALILFDTGADRSFMSTAFSSLIDIIPTTLDQDYDVELADGRVIGVNTIIRGCTLNFLNHPFNIDLMLVEIGSFDIIISMERLSKYRVVVVCAEKIIRIPFGNKILIVHGDGSNNEHRSRLNIISCTKTQKYLLKGCHVFLAHVITKKAKDKSEENQLEGVLIVRDFLKVFPEDLLGIPPTRQVEIQIDLIPGRLID